MILKKIELQGFGSYRDYNSVVIPEGLCGIVGRYTSNIDKSIGSGKSTLIMSILYALFGAGEFDTLDQLLNDSLPPKSPFFVRLTFTQNNVEYVVERGRKPESYLDLYQDGKPLGDPTIAKRTEEICRIVGMDYGMFTASIFFEQDRLSKLVDVESSQRRMYIEKVLGISFWTECFKESQRDYNALIKSIEENQEEIHTLEGTIKDRKTTIESLELLVKDVLENKSLLKVLQDKLNSFKQAKETLKTLSSLQTSLTQTKNSITELDNTIKSLQSSITSSETSISESEKSLIEIQESISSLMESEKSLTCEISSLQEDLQNKRENLTKVISQSSEVSAYYKTLLEKKASLKAGTCDKCYQEVSEEYVAKKYTEFDADIESTGKLLQSLQSQKDILSQELQICESSLKSAQTGLDTTKRLLQTNQKKLLETQHLIDKKKTEIEHSNQQIQLHLNSIKSYQEICESLTHKIEDLQNTIPKDFDYNNISHIESQIKELEKKIQEQEVASGRLQRLQEELSSLEDIFISKSDNLKSSLEEKRCFEVVLAGFRDIPTSIFEQSVVSIEKEASRIIHHFIPEMDIIVYEDKTKTRRTLEVAFEVEGRRRMYSRLSGGQKTIANLALRLGFSKVISSRVGVPIEFLVLDEPFGYLDSFNRDLVKKILREISQWFRQILVISHIDNVQEFPNLIQVTMDENHVSHIS